MAIRLTQEQLSVSGLIFDPLTPIAQQSMLFLGIAFGPHLQPLRTSHAVDYGFILLPLSNAPRGQGRGCIEK